MTSLLSSLPRPLPATPPAPPRARRLPVGAEPQTGGGVHFRVWAPRRRRVEVLCDTPTVEIIELAAEGNGYFSGAATLAGPGTRYRLRLDGQLTAPDPASRFQPEGPRGPSEVVDPAAFAWSDAGWRGLAREGQVFYELHVGSFTREGTWAAAARELGALAALGVTALQVMPVAEFPGRFGWGYDGVAWFAPSRLYGRPDDFRRFVDRAHALGIGVVLNVVYDHFGPDGCTLPEFSDTYLSKRHDGEWGAVPNFDGDGCGPVREFVLGNAGYWIDEFHLDGLQLDAAHAIHDDSTPHILQQVGQRVRAAAGRRGVLLANGNERQDASFVRPAGAGGHGLDMLRNDDWHHAAHVAATGRDEASLADYRGRPQEFVSAARHGLLFQGQWSRRQGERRGAPAFDLAPPQFVHCLDNHDQLANSGFGERLHQRTSPARWRALSALLLLGPQTPMLFQGQEFACSAPFVYFADHVPELAERVQQGRRAQLAQAADLALPEVAEGLPPPHAAGAFERCRLDHRERTYGRHQQAWQMHRDLIALRREDPCLARAQHERGRVEGAVLGDDAFVLRFVGDGGDDRLLLVNLGRTLHLDPVPEPLLAPPAGGRWRLAWSSLDPAYGGSGTPPCDAAEADRTVPGQALPRTFENWRLPGESAVLLAPDTGTRAP